MNKNALLLFSFVFLLVGSLSVSAGADQSLIASKIYLRPYYMSSTTANVPTLFTLQVLPPDGVESVQNALISFELYVSPTVTISLKVNGKNCNNPTFSISTSFMGAGRGTASFDCSNVITSAGTYNVSMTSDKNTGAGYGWLDLTYRNTPKARLAVSGTDYEVGDNGKIFTQLVLNNVPVVNSSCFVKAWYPNSTVFVPYTLMTYLDEGVYYYDFTAPTTVGVYPISTKCDYLTTTNNYSVNSAFRLLGAGAGALNNLDSLDGSYFDMSENAGDNRLISADYNFTSVNLTSATSLTVQLGVLRTPIALDPATDLINVYLLNYTSNKFILFSSPLNYTSSVTSYAITFFSANYTDFVRNGNVTLRINDTLGALTSPTDVLSTILRIDLLQLQVTQSIGNTTVESIGGTGELNIRRHFTETNNLLNDVSSIVNTTNISLYLLNISVNNNSALLAQLLVLQNGMNSTLGNLSSVQSFLSSMNQSSSIALSSIQRQLESMSGVQNTTLVVAQQVNTSVNGVLTSITVLNTSMNGLQLSMLGVNNTLFLFGNNLTNQLTNNTLLLVTNNNLLQVINATTNATFQNVTGLNIGTTNLSAVLTALGQLNTTSNLLLVLANQTNLTTSQIFTIAGIISNVTDQTLGVTLDLQYNMTRVRASLQNITVSIATLQSSINSVSIDVTDLQNSMTQVKNNLTYLVFLEQNETSNLTINLTSEFNNLQNTLNEQTITLSQLNTTTNNILSNLTSHIVLENASEAIELLYFQDITLNLTSIIGQLNGLAINVSSQNLTDLNNSLTGLIISTSASGSSLSTTSFFLIIMAVLFALMFFIDKPILYLIAGVYTLFMGFFLIPDIGTPLGLVLLFTGLACMIIGAYRVK